MNDETNVTPVEPPNDQRQLRFCEVYLSSTHRDPVKCIQEVYPELSLEQARGKAGQFMRPQHKAGRYIHDVIRRMHQDLLPSMRVTEGSVIAQVARLAFSNVKRLYDDDGRMLTPDELDYDTAAAVTEVTERVLKANEMETVVERKYKLAEKGKHLEMLGRYMQLFVDKNETNLNIVSGEMLDLISKGNDEDSPIPK
ncbi:hypothetical protein KUW19_00795 [Ferrimonas balearica]|uniref:terminase small subunit n=1 Tax=Ferrimonas balearica TaxID=44012 RepID=UPI001C93E133|nr:terminase small subunit [Ferrimonas balearica]MBY6105014.1 hypothetical protein [Ferrimonas balearica]